MQIMLVIQNLLWHLRVPWHYFIDAHFQVGCEMTAINQRFHFVPQPVLTIPDEQSQRPSKVWLDDSAYRRQGFRLMTFHAVTDVCTDDFNRNLIGSFCGSH